MLTLFLPQQPLHPTSPAGHWHTVSQEERKESGLRHW
ncbi:hypothetical protein E2C01_081143 [Portunus trituberculatus]|uniref:Uncharacterized protein n=1 Tax=Portunus trituberculatus TaxID=210409 RepID=A0A5B7IP16_PORTR|nr:hypothetical protein [Portunus trituberculatus]